MKLDYRINQLEEKFPTKRKQWGVISMHEGDDEQERKTQYCQEHGCHEEDMDWWVVVCVAPKGMKTNKS
jgi:hypothetical protein